MARVLITDAEQRAALAVVRSLGRRGDQVFVCSSQSRPLAGFSRACAGTYVVPDQNDPAAFVSEIQKLLQLLRIEYLVPISETSLRALLPAAATLPARMPFPDAATFSAISDKANVAAVAERIGLHVPQQYAVATKQHVPRTLPADAFPLVVKPTRSVVTDQGQQRKLTVAYANNDTDVKRILEKLPGAAFPVLLQRRIVGPGVGIFLLRWDGQTRAQFAHRRIREKPPSGGVSVLSESTVPEPELLNQAEKLLAEFDWRGVAMVEFKIDSTTGTPYLMEVNGRFWGSLQLAIDSGVDFPALLLACAEGAPALSPPQYRTGVRTRWFCGDLDHLLVRLLRSRAQLRLAQDAPSRGSVVRSFLASFHPRVRNEVFRLSDPRPGVYELISWVGQLAGR